jgi:hypothetical protein
VSNTPDGLSGGAIAGIVIGSVAGAAIIVIAIIMVCKKKSYAGMTENLVKSKDRTDFTTVAANKKDVVMNPTKKDI